MLYQVSVCLSAIFTLACNFLSTHCFYFVRVFLWSNILAASILWPWLWPCQRLSHLVEIVNFIFIGGSGTHGHSINIDWHICFYTNCRYALGLMVKDTWIWFVLSMSVTCPREHFQTFRVRSMLWNFYVICHRAGTNHFFLRLDTISPIYHWNIQRNTFVRHRQL